MFDLISLVKTAGYIGLFVMIFSESGILLGIFFPGDSLLFTAGLLASQGLLNIWFLIPLVFLAAVAGDSVGYFFGKKVGPKIFNKEESLFFRKDYINKAQDFFAKYGSKAVVLVRFIPILRTLAPILAGVGTMRYKTFLTYNLIGGFLWSVGVTSIGFFLGNAIPNVDHYLLPIILFIVFISILPGIVHILKSNFSKQK